MSDAEGNAEDEMTGQAADMAPETPMPQSPAGMAPETPMPRSRANRPSRSRSRDGPEHDKTSSEDDSDRRSGVRLEWPMPNSRAASMAPFRARPSAELRTKNRFQSIAPDSEL